jgi:replicative DNA helicase
MTAAAPTLSVVPAASTVEEPPKFNFDAEFQARIAALTLRDSTFNSMVDGLVKADYFESEIEAYLVGAALRYFQKYKKAPAGLPIYAMLIRDDIDSKVLPKNLAAAAIGRLKELFAEDISDREFVVDQVATFARHQAVQEAMFKAIPMLDKGNFDAISTLMRGALDVGATSGDDEYDYGAEIDTRTATRLQRAAGKAPPTGITTGYKVIDELLFHKGWGRKELQVILGGPKAGKTTSLIDFGLNAWAAGFNVLYASCEVGKDVISARMDANVSQTLFKELDNHTHEVRQKVAEHVQKCLRSDGTRSVFKVHEYPTGGLKPSELRRLIERYKTKGVVFDLVIVDYADIMCPERHTDSAIENSKSIYVDLRGIAIRENCAVLTATQANRLGSNANVIKAEHVAEDFNKVRIADLMISINRTDEERAAGRARLFFAASRNQEGEFTLEIEQALDRMKFITRVLGFV